MKLYQCNKCGYKWKKKGLSIIPKCSKCGSHDVSELKHPERDYEEGYESRDVELGDQGQGI